jgi:hypothetical protein
MRKPSVCWPRMPRCTLSTMFFRPSVLVASACAAVTISACGSSMSPAARIRANYGRLTAAFRNHDAVTMCELLFPFAEHQPRSALAAGLNRLDTKAGRSSWQTYVDRCVPSLSKNPSNFTVYEQLFRGVSLGIISVHGNTATARITSKGRRLVGLTFVRAAGDWRLLVGVQ